MTTEHYSKKGWLVSGLLGILISSMLFTTANAAARQNLWQSRDQFVALEPQERTSDALQVPNSHPADLKIDRLTAQLSSITVQPGDSEATIPLFTPATLDVLAPQLRLALQRATADQDVTFAVIGLHTALYGFAKSPKVTTGRIFYQGGRLNLIVGLMQQQFNERDDRRLAPFTPGSRHQHASGTWALQPQTGQDGFILLRKDWVAFTPEWHSPVMSAPLTDQQAAPANPPAAATIQAPPRQPAERLTTLKELRDKGLISAEEYQATRLKILEGL